MFTGIVQGLAEVADVHSKENLSQVRIKLPSGKAAGVQIGASVAINGTCLTVTAADGDTLSFDIMVETLRATSLGGLAAGSKVNYERAARVGDEIGGHNVSGHVHTTAAIKAVEDTANNRRVTFEVKDSKWMKYILPKVREHLGIRDGVVCFPLLRRHATAWVVAGCGGGPRSMAQPAQRVQGTGCWLGTS